MKPDVNYRIDPGPKPRPFHPTMPLPAAQYDPMPDEGTRGPDPTERQRGKPGGGGLENVPVKGPAALQ